MVHFSEIQRFSDFLETFPENVHIICRHFKFSEVCFEQKARYISIFNLSTSMQEFLTLTTHLNKRDNYVL